MGTAALVDYNSNAGVLQGWVLQTYRGLVVPLQPVIIGFLWLKVFFANPAYIERQKRQALRQSFRDAITQQALDNAKHSDVIQAQVQQAAAQHAQEVLQSELGYFVAPTPNSGQTGGNSGQSPAIDYTLLAQAIAAQMETIPAKSNGHKSPKAETA